MFHERINSPTRSVGENNIAFFSRPFCKCYTSVFLPVPHGLTENGPLAAWKEFKFDSFSMCANEHKALWERVKQLVFTQNSPLKFPLIMYGMMPSGHTRSGREVAALLRRWSLRRPAALLLLTLSLEVELVTATAGTRHWFSPLQQNSVNQVRVANLSELLIPDSVWLFWRVCGATSRPWLSLNMRRSSSSRAISPQKAAGRGQMDTGKHGTWSWYSVEVSQSHECQGFCYPFIPGTISDLLIYLSDLILHLSLDKKQCFCHWNVL